MSNTLTYHTSIGSFFSNVDPVPGTPISTTPEIDDVSAYVKFSYRLPQGFSVFIPDFDPGDGSDPANASISFPDRVARLMDGKLCTIEVGDPEGVELVSNSAILGLASRGISDLFIDVAFFNVTVAANQLGTLDNFSYIAPTDTTGVDLTSPTLVRHQYGGTLPIVPVTLTTGVPPTHYNSAGTKGQTETDGTHLYICYATNLWRRTTITWDAATW